MSCSPGWACECLRAAPTWWLASIPGLADGGPRELSEVGGGHATRSQENRPAVFAAAASRFAAAVRALGERIEPLRRALPVEKRDEASFRRDRRYDQSVTPTSSCTTTSSIHSVGRGC